MNNVSNSTKGFFHDGDGNTNALVDYIQSLHPETIARLSNPEPEVRHAMESSIVNILGHLPAEHFGMTVTTSRENLGRLLASAMVNGYFLHVAQQRMAMEKSIPLAIAADESDPDMDGLE